MQAARETTSRQRAQALAEAQLAFHKASATQAEAQRRLDEANKPNEQADADPNSEAAKARKAAAEKATKEIEAARKKTFTKARHSI